MKKLLILTLAIFCFYGCKSTPEESDTSFIVSPWGDLSQRETIKKLAWSSGLLGAYTNNICNKGIYSLRFNGNNYSKMTINYERQEDTQDSGLTRFGRMYSHTKTESEVLEENNGVVTLTITTSRVSGNYFKDIETYKFNTKTKAFIFSTSDIDGSPYEDKGPIYEELGTIKNIREYCSWVNTKINEWNKSVEKIIADSTPSETFTINGKNFSTNYSKLQQKREKNGKYLEYWVATNDELKDIVVKEIASPSEDAKNYTRLTRIIDDFSFIEK